ncbi:CCA tRNA nucleotidyltransferase, mitochondrial [Nakaseomyces bracarensis]|uniref:CCA tRNA nucleotidyltransferase, mitochondrial n=1 Tax=Nakaseomyces bracarensis TaxID=273131 RepID=A0ABR4NX76_9SACH
MLRQLVRRMTMNVPRIQLSEKESKICDLLKDYSIYYNAQNRNSEPLTLRITGGWVRDKLLGQKSHDLDIAINIMSGEEFAMGLNVYLEEHFDRYGIKPHNIHKIDKNPEKSKHLETATTKLFDLEVDFVNLRSEEYTEESRIPTTKFGTPEEDALRRDATLNALFYNIQLDKVEDFTKRGLQDLNDGVLRTPLPARQTFLDDPLRVLRLIRFASRFNFNIESTVLKEMHDPEINEAFNNKISRERIGVEMDKILIGPNPILGLVLIQRTHLENVIFYWHGDESVINYNKEHWPQTKFVEEIYKNGSFNQHLKNLLHHYKDFLSTCVTLRKMIELRDKEFQENFLLGSILLPMANLKIVALPNKKLNNTATLTESIIKEGLKFSKTCSTIVSRCVENAESYSDMVKQFTDSGHIQRSRLGNYIRSLRGDWEIVHFVSLMSKYLNNISDKDHIESIISSYDNFREHVLSEGLEDSDKMAPLIDGKRMIKILGMKPGPWLGKVNDDIILWQFDNPTGTEEQLIEYVKEILPKYS